MLALSAPTRGCAGEPGLAALPRALGRVGEGCLDRRGHGASLDARRLDPDEGEAIGRSLEHLRHREDLPNPEVVGRDRPRLDQLLCGGLVHCARPSAGPRGVDEDRAVDSVEQLEQIERSLTDERLDAGGQRRVSGEAPGDERPGRIVAVARADADYADPHGAPLRSM
jgi:hypothetical protein